VANPHKPGKHTLTYRYRWINGVPLWHFTDFLLELGDDFAFVGRQRRIRIDDNWFRVDLVFFHRRLKSILIVESQD
jgi:hypothetical protein